MKAGSLKFCFLVSIAFHSLVFGAVVLGGFAGYQPAPQPDDSIVKLTLIAAPSEPSVVPIPRPDEVVAPTPEPPAPPIPAPMQTIEPVLPVEVVQEFAPSVPPPQTVSLPKPILAMADPEPALPTKVRGDNSSIVPGQDATTLAARPGVKAHPNYLKNPEPPYPLLARRRHQEGLVMLSVKVTAQGRAGSVELKQSSRYPLLDDAALQAVRTWEFEPARVGGVALDSEIEVPVRFELR